MLRKHGGKHSLFYAVEEGMPEVVTECIKEGAELEACDHRGRTALAHACVHLGNTKRLSGSRVTAAETAATLAVGCWVNVTATFTSVSEIPVKVSKGSLGKVVEIDYEGGCALLDFEGIGGQWVSKNDGDSISVLSQDHVVKGEAGQMYLAPREEVLKRRAQREEMVLMLIELTQAASALDVPNNEGSTVLMHACTYGLCGVVKQLLDAEAKADLTDSNMRTALTLAIANGHEEAAKMLIAPTKAAGALDVVGTDGFSALLWAEELKLDSAVQKLSESGAAAGRRPALALFRGECATVRINVAERTVAFNSCNGNYTTLCSTRRCPAGRKGYFELEILDISTYSQHHYGFASATFQRVLGFSDKRLGEDEQSWSVNPLSESKWHNGWTGYVDFGVSRELKAGDVVSVACDLENMQILISVNGGKRANGVVFDLTPDAARDGFVAAFSGKTGKVRYNLGEAAFQYTPPPSFVAFSEFDGVLPADKDGVP